MKEVLSAGNIKKQDKFARQESIIDAAERVFAAKPFNRVSMRDVAREAGITHAAIYRYFPDQQAMFVSAFLRGSKKVIAFLKEQVDDTKNAGIEKVTEKFIGYLINNDLYFRMMTHFMLDGTLGGEMLEKLNTAERELFDQLDRLFVKLKISGDTRMLSHAFFAALNGVLISFRNYPGRDRAEIEAHMIKLGKIIAQKFKGESI
ncbi:MAG: TetR/AcrR family transcriptional regulator [Spirochaetes bacterium]|nr:TetR/AcrR family transcriptional regulator [Spirochaetota bacterium]